jgi:hypothetical protein
VKQDKVFCVKTGVFPAECDHFHFTAFPPLVHSRSDATANVKLQKQATPIVLSNNMVIEIVFANKTDIIIKNNEDKTWSMTDMAVT